MLTNYKWLYKMVLIANKNPNKKYYLDFSDDCLSANRDWDWLYESSKTYTVRDFIEWTFKHDCSKREVKKTCKQLCKNICFYDEHIALAKNITKRYKSKIEV